MSLRKLRNLPFFQKLFSYNGMKSQMAFMDTKCVGNVYHVKQKRFIDKTMSLSVGEMKDQLHLCDILKKPYRAANISDITDSANSKTVGVINIEPQNINVCPSAVPITHGGYVVMDSYMDIKPGKDMLAKFAVFGEAAGK